jgi:hypothetical protein
VFPALPIPEILQAAILQELETPLGGIWYDQICINQGNASEKAISIGLMDLIYQQARRTVVPLADVELDEGDIEYLESYIPEYLAIAISEEHEWRVPPSRFHASVHGREFKALRHFAEDFQIGMVSKGLVFA